MISIITPIYNVEPYIERCANSLFNQTYNDIEYIFVDDYSPDATISKLEQVLEKYPSRKSNVKIIRHPKNKGVAAARNTGLTAAIGDYIYFVDADDWIEKDTIERMYQQSNCGDIDIIACGWYLCFNKNERKMPMPSYPNAESGLRGMLSGQMRWNLWLYMIKKELYDKYDIHFIDGENVGEDMLVLIKLFSKATSISFVEAPLYHYVRQNSNAITQMSPEEQMKRLSNNLYASINYLGNTYPGKYDKELNFFKLNVKMPLLITDDKKAYLTWKKYFPEANEYIMQNKMQTLRMRLVQLMAAKGQFWLVKLYYLLIFKFVYGVLYK